jgi:S-adenosylmethionine:diacylglycerol 3-amino-3-carboxypropyl transferase
MDTALVIASTTTTSHSLTRFLTEVFDKLVQRSTWDAPSPADLDAVQLPSGKQVIQIGSFDT